ncbi:MAG: outer membrane beta-barrel protein [Myxococcota bacterium]
MGSATSAHAEDKKVSASSVWDSFLEKASGQAFASGYYMFNAHTTAGAYNTVGYPYTINQGFGLNFAGLDGAYDGDDLGVTVNLRFGTAAAALTPLAPIKQAYGTWKVSDSFSLDLGFFDTIYGAEVADEWANVNFSRGALYFTRQPFNHMGARGNIAVGDNTNIAFIIANGTVFGGQPIDDNEVPSFGGQISFSGDSSFLAIGYIAGPNGTDGNGRFSHLIDIVNTYTIDKLSIIANVDVTIDPEPAEGADLALQYGGSLAFAYETSATTSFGLRGEFLGSNDTGGPEDYLVTVTGTIRYKPTPNLIISVEPRAEFSDLRLFVADDGNKKWFFGGIVGLTAVIGS